MINKQKTVQNLIAAGLLSTALATTAATASQLRHATGYAPGSMGAEATNNYADALRDISGGTVTGKVFALSLLNWAEMSDGIRDGITDSGTVLFSYFPSTFPVNSMLAELSMVAQLGDVGSEQMGPAYAGALSEYIFLHCPQCLTEFENQNQIFTGIGATSPYWLLCNEPVASLEQIKGKRLRAAGANWSRWAQELGATPVTMSHNDVYEGLSQGVLDCTMMSTPELTLINLMEVTTDITTGVPGGLFAGLAVSNVNKNTWAGLDQQQKESVMRAGASFSADISWLYQMTHDKNMATARASDRITVHEPAADLVEATQNFIRTDSAKIGETYRENHNIEGAPEMVEQFIEILNRWQAKVEGIESQEELAQLYWDEIFSKVDVSSYGQ
ncbi:C4-dicarboxylate TRAP transporter substrate-binding protein [uncultured Marinobacter sp.]|mgnify:FL=1|uniref:C4-dicarboxylate TRAP transporter substrate-binding protein n=1 Tax=uncultured Marinobacter sp. TaxID=187379 RepID=UPI0030D8BF65